MIKLLVVCCLLATVYGHRYSSYRPRRRYTRLYDRYSKPAPMKQMKTMEAVKVEPAMKVMVQPKQMTKVVIMKQPKHIPMKMTETPKKMTRRVVMKQPEHIPMKMIGVMVEEPKPKKMARRVVMKQPEHIPMKMVEVVEMVEVMEPKPMEVAKEIAMEEVFPKHVHRYRYGYAPAMEVVEKVVEEAPKAVVEVAEVTEVKKVAPKVVEMAKAVFQPGYEPMMEVVEEVVKPAPKEMKAVELPKLVKIQKPHHGYRYVRVEKAPKPEPYQFSYDIKDDYHNSRRREESGDAHGNVKGSYEIQLANGLKRVVSYVADKGGFRAKIDTNEPGTDNQSPADVHLTANPVTIKLVPKKVLVASKYH